MRLMLFSGVTVLCSLLSSCSSQTLSSSEGELSTLEQPRNVKSALEPSDSKMLNEAFPSPKVDEEAQVKTKAEKQPQATGTNHENPAQEERGEKDGNTKDFTEKQPEDVSTEKAPEKPQQGDEREPQKDKSTPRNAGAQVQPEQVEPNEEVNEPAKIGSGQTETESKKVIDPTTFQEFFAPEKYKHPLRFAKTLNFMIGEDSRGSYLYGEGPITTGAFDKFLKYVKHFEQKGVELNRLMLHSPGGVLNEGIQIGNYLLANNWETDADKYMRCYSTCGFIYAAGKIKRIQTGAEIGFHRPYLPNEPDTPEFIEAVYNEYKGYWNAVGADMELYETFMREYGRDDMLILETETIKQYIPVEAY